MTLLGWMHRKIRQNSSEPFKDFTIGNCCNCLTAQSTLDDQDYYSKPSFGSICGSLSSKLPKQESKNSISEIEAKGLDESFNKQASVVISELFHGFLAIGTLGSEPIMSEPATPTFAMSAENITEEKTEVTEYDLKLINNELGKFLEAEAEEEKSNESSRRNSYVSIVTLIEKPLEGANSEDYGKMQVCPLQGYLFGSSIELPETAIEVRKEKASLAELFRRTKIIDEHSMEKSGKEEMPAKRTHKSVKHLVKKMLRKFHASSGSLTSSDTDSASAKKRLNKVIQMFHRKIHPEKTVAEKEFAKSHKSKTNTPYDDGYVGRGLMLLDKDNRGFPQGSKSKEWAQYCKNNKKLLQDGISCNTSSGNKEHWIKTDADCKY
ncbi:hypothetical protein Q3G72_002585 [Acer saccharum]|nr:hypothetical protein Q3G72_002585 [Acer saccharum]